MLKLKKINLYRVKNIKFKYFYNLNLIFCYNIATYVKIYMPSYYFFFSVNNQNYFIFLNKELFKSLLKQLLNYLNSCAKFYFFKIKLRGLGYKLEKFSSKLYRFFFAYNHYFYFHVPQDVFVKNRRRTLIVLSNKLSKINDIFSHLLLLKKLDLYERNNTFIVSKQIKFFKKRK